jgi:8-oxo-dGTP pyrophosphatase MutT (NUDIX family)
MLLSRKPKSKERPALIVQALIRKNTGEYLVIKRAKEVEKGAWEFPGGRVDPGETVEKALEREVMEETNLKVDIERFVGWGQGFGLKETSGKLVDRFVMFFECKLIKGKLRLCPELSDHKWAALEEFMQFKPLSEPVRDFVRKFQLIPDHLFQDDTAIIK